MEQPRRDRSLLGIGRIGLAFTFSGLLLGGTFCVCGCDSGQGTGMIENAAENPAANADAKDSMNAYMKSMQTKGMKPGMKGAAPSKK
jgi:hypothetical protein